MTDTDNNNEKKKKDRSAAYPSLSLADAVEHLKQIHNDLGKGPFDRDSAAKSLGYNGVSGASASKIAALVHYGLIQRTGGGYIETDLGTSIVLSFDEEEERRALREAFKSPTLFSKLIDDFGGKSLPVKLEVILVRQYRITEQASRDAAKAFRESAEYVGILKNGFLQTDGAMEDTQQSSSMVKLGVRDVISDNRRPGNPSIADTATNDISIEVGKGLRVVFSQGLMLDVAAGRFSSGISQLTQDLAAIAEPGLDHKQQIASQSDGHEEAQ